MSKKQQNLLFEKQREKLYFLKEKILFRERKISKGQKYPNVQIYIVRRNAVDEGICSVINAFLGQFQYVDQIQSDKRVIPVVDMQSYHSKLWMQDEKGNDWELYFEQPVKGFGLGKVVHAKNIILGNGVIECPNLVNIYFEEEKLLLYHKIFQKYIHLNEETKEYIDKKYRELFCGERKIIGCFVRMGINSGKELDANLTRKQKEQMNRILPFGFMKNYPDQPDRQELLELIKEKQKAWGATHVFVSVDDSETLEFLKGELGDKLLYIPRNRMQVYQNGKAVQYLDQYTNVSLEEKHDRNLGYLTEIVLLSKCDSIICGKSSGAATAFIMNGNEYKHKFIYSSLYKRVEQKGISAFCGLYEKIYIYGAGEWGCHTANYLENAGIDYQGFVISDGREGTEILMGHPVYNIARLKADENTGVIVAIKNYTEVKTELDKRNLKNYIVLGD